MDTSLVFGDLDLKKFQPAINKQNGTIVLRDEENDIIIDRITHAVIANFLRKVFRIEKNVKRPGNEEAKKYMIERATVKYERQKKKAPQSVIENYIISLVNTPEYKYNYQTTLKLSIYQFYSSLYQIIRKVKFDNLMIGCYAGTVNTEKIDQAELNWLSVDK